MNEKRDRFVRLAEKRVNSVLDKIRLVGNLSDKRYYEYSDEDSKKIIEVLQKQLNITKNKFSSDIKKNNKRFTLGD